MMRLQEITFILFIGLIIINCKSTPNSTGSNIKNKAKKAVQGIDHVFSPTDTNNLIFVQIPERVKNRIDSILQEQPSSNLEEVYQINYNDSISIFVAKTNDVFKGRQCYIIAFDSSRKIETKAPPCINSKWLANNEIGFKERFKLYKKPFISFRDIDSDGTLEISVKERVHNGNIYNALLNKFFRLDLSTMQMNLFLVLEEKYIHFMDNTCVFERFIDNEKLIVKKDCHEKSSEKIGSALLKFEKNKVELIELKCHLPENEGLLITGSGEDPVKFINSGYEFSY